MSTTELDDEALTQSRQLVSYLTELTDHSRRTSTPDICDGTSQAPEVCLWWRDLPADTLRPDPKDDDLLLRIKPVVMVPPPQLPADLVDWVDPALIRRAGQPWPVLLSKPLATIPGDLASVDLEQSESEDLDRAARRRRSLFDDWIARWSVWSDEEPVRQHRQQLYEKIEHAAQMMEQRDDEYEFVVGVGYLAWHHPDWWLVRRHLLIEKAHPKVDRSGTLTIRRLPSTRRLEDPEMLGGMDGIYHPERAKDDRAVLLSQPAPIDSPEVQEQLSSWLGVAIAMASDRDDGWNLDALPEDRPKIAAAPAFLLRPRTKVLIAEAYRAIGEALEQDDSDIPVGLAQLVVETDRPTRDRWLAVRNATSGDVLGEDPLFPLPSNSEQSRVMELLRTETGIVVQGPPGTGKTHTIANLISALLARGQRVLVTSQKDQALRVLREKIPEPLRRLCVLLAGGSRDAAAELEKGIEALSDAIASNDERSLAAKVLALGEERARLLQDSEILNQKVRALREVERKTWDSVVPQYEGTTYAGTLAEIVRQTQEEAPSFEWMPPVPASEPLPPLSAAEFRDLYGLLAGASPARAALANLQIPSASEIPTRGDLVRLFVDEQEMSAAPPVGPAALLIDGDEETLEALRECATEYQRMARDSSVMTTGWSRRAVDDLIGNRRGGLWRGLLDVGGEAGRLLSELNDSSRSAVEVLHPVTAGTVADTQYRIKVGEALREHLRKGGKFKAHWPIPKVQKEAESLLEAVLVDGRRIEAADQLEAALAHLRAEVASIRLADRWKELEVDVTVANLRPRLAELSDHADLLRQAIEMSDLVSRFRTAIGSLPIAVRCLDDFVSITVEIPQVLAARRAREAVGRIDAATSYLRGLAERDICVDQMTALADAVSLRDSDKAGSVLEELQRMRDEQAAEARCGVLSGRLTTSHPALLARIRAQLDADWYGRDIAAAWAWSLAASFVSQNRTVAEERRLVKEYTGLVDQLRIVTGELVAAEALRACLARLTDQHTRALNTYREHMGKIGAGTGRKTAEFRRAAKAAMEKARDAVPAWVVPLGNLLENLPAHRDRFDVVIVDEASQVGIEHLYLLWMAPRVIVVGDDKQCTPGVSAMGTLDEVFDRQRDRLGGLPEDIRTNLTPKSNLYGVLSARAGKNGLVRLREHFRCVPEIIRWSSDQFYAYGADSSGLIPLRERRADDLEPLKVLSVEGGVVEGSQANRRNEVEARELVQALQSCLKSPAYEGKTFGIVVLASGATGHVKKLEHLINDYISPEDRQSRGIRVGTAPNFQGDERDVIFLSTVAVGKARLTRALQSQQAYNVAVSRAREQLWLVTSLRSADLQPNDLRASLLAYMNNPPSIYGKSPELDSVPPTERVKPFDSLFEQQVFRSIRERGYHVVPQFAVGSRSLDLVVAGAGGRIAVECDGHYYHAGVDQQVSDARRDSELVRMGWDTVRIRESEFAFDAEHELAKLWQLLEKRDIKPGDLADGASAEWQPTELDDDEEQDD